MADLINDLKLSTVVPASITAEDQLHHFTNIDLAMKLHYITTVHFFGGDAAAELTIHRLKEHMFRWLQLYYPICGRIRAAAADRGRLYVKCNDSGVRIAEATCTVTVDELLAAGGNHDRILVYHQPILVDELEYTPLVFLQITKFKCGGLSVGMRWAHMIGDAFSAIECINMWGKVLANLPIPSNLVNKPPTTNPQSITPTCTSLKLLDPLLNYCSTPNNFKMQTHTFHISGRHLTDLLSSHDTNTCKAKPFAFIAAIVWKSLAKIRGPDDVKIVTVCKFDHAGLENEMPNNAHEVIGRVEARREVKDVDLIELAMMIEDKFVDETAVIEKEVEEARDRHDFVVYGSKLSFVNLEEVDLYGLKMNGKGPVFANLSIGGVGDAGAVIIVPYSGGGRTVNVTLPEDQILHLKNELREEWGIF